MGRRLRALAKATQLCLITPLALVGYAILFPIIELVYYKVFFQRELKNAQKLTKPQEMSWQRRNYIFYQMGEAMRRFGWEKYKAWFINTESWETAGVTCLEDVRLMMSWSLFVKRDEDLNAHERAYLCKGLTQMQLNTKHWFPNKKDNQKSRPYLHTWEAVVASYKPFLLYLLVWLVGQFYQSLLFWRGFERYDVGKLRYWHRRADHKPYDEPMVFFHGIGVGLAQYLVVLPYLPHKTQVLLENPWIAFNFWTTYHDTTPPSRDEWISTIRHIFKRHGIEKAEFISQSFGTFQTGWVLNWAPELVSRVLLMDPVSLYLCLPNTAISFLVKFRMEAYNTLITGTKYLFSSELGIARMMCRHLWWYDVVVFPEQIPKGSLVLIHKDDLLIPADCIYESLKDREDVTCLSYPGDHAEFMLNPYQFARWREDIRKYYEMLGTKNYKVGRNPMPYLVKLNAGWDIFGIGKMLGIVSQVLKEMGQERAVY